MLTNLLNLFAGLGERGSGSGPARVCDPPCDFEMARTVFLDIRKAGVKLEESCFTAVVRMNCMHAHEAEALEIYREMQTFNISPKNRTLTPLLARFSEVGDHDTCFSLYEEMIRRYELEPVEKDYISMLNLTVSLRDERFYAILDRFMEMNLVPSSAVWPVLESWFANSQTNFSVAIVKPSLEGQISVNPIRL